MTSSPIALIAEDDPSLAEMFMVVLQEAGFQPIHAGDGKVALIHLAKITPGLVILDLYMPHFDGEEILKYMRQEKRLANVWVLVTTADLTKARDIAQWKDPYLVFLTKPFSLDMLSTTLQQYRTLIQEEQKREITKAYIQENKITGNFTESQGDTP